MTTIETIFNNRFNCLLTSTTYWTFSFSSNTITKNCIFFLPWNNHVSVLRPYRSIKSSRCASYCRNQPIVNIILEIQIAKEDSLRRFCIRSIWTIVLPASVLLNCSATNLYSSESCARGNRERLYGVDWSHVPGYAWLPANDAPAKVSYQYPQKFKRENRNESSNIQAVQHCLRRVYVGIQSWKRKNRIQRNWVIFFVIRLDDFQLIRMEMIYHSIDKVLSYELYQFRSH